MDDKSFSYFIYGVSRTKKKMDFCCIVIIDIFRIVWKFWLGTYFQNMKE